MSPQNNDNKAINKTYSKSAISVNNAESIAQFLRVALSSARQELLILSREFDPKILDNELVFNGIERFLLRNKYAGIRVILYNAKPAIRRDHRLITLSRRLSSKIQIKIQSKEYSYYEGAFFIIDRLIHIYRPNGSRYDSIIDTANPALTKEYAKLFDSMWSSSIGDLSLKRLHL